MIAKQISSYFHFGTCVRFLQDARVNQLIIGDGYVLSNLNSFFGYLDDLNLQVSKRASYKLQKLTNSFQELPESSTLTELQCEELTKYINEVRLTLNAELQGFDAYVVTPKRLDTTRLIGNVDELFNPEIFWYLPDIAIHDFNEAGRSIAFECSTAAAFHLLRGTEAVLRAYYQEIVKRNRCQLMWGNIVQDLRKKKPTQERITLLNNLDNIRLSFRNPTQHPEKIYDIQEVQDLFGLCVDVVNRMAKEKLILA